MSLSDDEIFEILQKGDQLHFSESLDAMVENEDCDEVEFYKKVGGGDSAAEDMAIRSMLYQDIESVIENLGYKELRMFLVYHGIHCIYCGISYSMLIYC